MTTPTTKSGPSLSHARTLRRHDDIRLRRYGLAVLVTALLPLSLGADGGLYLWDVVGVVAWGDLIGGAAPLLLGTVLVGLSYAPALTRLGQSLLALAALVVGTTWLTASPVALEAAFQGLLAFVGRRPLLVTTGLALIAAGADLRLDDAVTERRDLPRRVARALLVAGSALIVLVYLLPQRGSPFAVLLGEQILATAWHGGARVVAGRALFWLLGLAPLCVALAAIGAAARPRRPGVLLSVGARYGLPLLAVLLCIPLLAAEPNPQRALLQARTAILLGVAIGVASRSIEAAARHLLETPLPASAPPSMLARDVRLRQQLAELLRRSDGTELNLVSPPGLPESHPWLRWLMGRRLVEIAAELPERPQDPLLPNREQAGQYAAVLDARFDLLHGSNPLPREPTPASPAPAWTRIALWTLTGRVRLPAIVALGALLSALALGIRLYEPAPDLRWTLGSPTEEADRLFGTTLPRFVVLLAQRTDRPPQRAASAETSELARRQASELIASATEVDPILGRRVERLVGAADALDRTGRLWLDAVHGVNRRVREMGLPYYLDGNVMQLRSRRRSSTRRIFYATTYRVEQVRRFTANGRPIAALHARRLDRLNIEGSRLGAVRPDEPFALVLLDGIERSVANRLEALTQRSSCALAADAWSTASTEARIDALCARTVLDLAAARHRGGNADDEALELEIGRLQIDATERHELQHQVDGPLLTVPTELYRMIPWADDEAVRTTARELSAHLAELDTDDSLATAWRLADLCTYLMRSRSRGTYRYAAATIVGRLVQGPVLERNGRVKIEQVLRLWQRVADGDTDLAAWVAPAARRAHEDLFGTPVAELKASD